MARSRLAPLKQLTIVRLELQAAVLAVRLANIIKQELTFKLDDTHYWSDSRVVLQYLSNESRRFHTFVGNRIAEIPDTSEIRQWHHIPGEMNPADVCTRGVTVSGLVTMKQWWRGPQLHVGKAEEWPRQDFDGSVSTEDPEVKPGRVLMFATPAPVLNAHILPDPSRFSNWARYKRIVGWAMRFANNLKARSRQEHDSILTGPLTAPELEAAELIIVKEHQARCYPQVIRSLAQGMGVSDDSMKAVTPFLDGQGVFRVGGRIDSASVSFCAKHPALLSRSDEVTRFIVGDAHRRVMHAGLEHTLSEVRNKYWIEKARSTVKSVLYKCVVCRNRRVQPQAPLMGQLPPERCDLSRPFAAVGIDFIGPFQVRKFRKTEPRYVLLVTCLATRGIHLEATTSLSTDTFLMALRRFFSRRGKPRVIYSDNATNFVGGEREMRQSINEWNLNCVIDTLSQDQIEWKFNTPTASHMGGAWERLVGSVKRAMKIVLGKQCVNDEVLHTVLTEVEYMVNSRPLTYVSSDARDPEPLTPNHFILGYPNGVLPPGVFDDGDYISRKRWRQAQVLASDLWKRWRREYLPTLIQRRKWTKDITNIAVGDVVLIVDQAVPRGCWPMARVTEVYPGRDGRIRSVDVRTAAGRTYKRPSNKICILERAA